MRALRPGEGSFLEDMVSITSRGRKRERETGHGQVRSGRKGNRQSESKTGEGLERKRA